MMHDSHKITRLAKGAQDFLQGSLSSQDFQVMLSDAGCVISHAHQTPQLCPQQTLLESYRQALQAGFSPQIKLIGLFTFFSLCPIPQTQESFKKIKSAYLDMIDTIVKELGVGVVIEFDEPILAQDSVLNELRCVYDRSAIECIYEVIPQKGIQTIVHTYTKEQK